MDNKNLLGQIAELEEQIAALPIGSIAQKKESKRKNLLLSPI